MTDYDLVFGKSHCRRCPKCARGQLKPQYHGGGAQCLSAKNSETSWREHLHFICCLCAFERTTATADALAVTP